MYRAGHVGRQLKTRGYSGVAAGLQRGCSGVAAGLWRRAQHRARLVRPLDPHDSVEQFALEGVGQLGMRRSAEELGVELERVVLVRGGGGGGEAERVRLRGEAEG